MNNRRSFLKDTLVILCASLLPKILRPSEAVVQEDVLLYPAWIMYQSYAEGTRFVKARQFWWAEYNSYTNRIEVQSSDLPIVGEPITVTINKNDLRN